MFFFATDFTENQLAVLTSAFRQLTHLMMQNHLMDRMSVFKALCSQISKQHGEWLRWFVFWFARDDGSNGDLEVIAEVDSIVKRKDHKKLEVVLRSSWINKIRLDVILSVAITNGDLQSCAMLHQLAGVQPPRYINSPLIKRYFKYATNPQDPDMNCARDYTKLKMAITEKHNALLAAIDEEDAEQATPTSKRRRECVCEKYTEELKKARTQYIQLASVLPSV